MYAGAVLCLVICIIIMYQITITRDTTLEWAIWIFVIAGFFLLGFGYVYEGRYKAEHPDEFIKAVN